MSQFVASCHGSVIEAGKRLLAAACCVFISVSPGIFRNTRVCTTACVCVCVCSGGVCVCVSRWCGEKIGHWYANEGKTSQLCVSVFGLLVDCVHTRCVGGFFSLKKFKWKCFDRTFPEMNEKLIFFQKMNLIRERIHQLFVFNQKDKSIKFY